MTMPAIPDLEEAITLAWLTAALQVGGALPRGAVQAVTAQANAAFNSAALHLTVTYTSDAPPEAPTRLFLKRNLATEWARESGAWEVSFYQLAAPCMADLLMLVPCYLAAYDRASDRSAILLADVSATHAPPVTRDQLIALDGVPPDDQLDAIIDTYARFHAFWWEHPALGAGVGQVSPWYRSPAHYEAHVARRQVQWAAFNAVEGATLLAEDHVAYAQILAGLPALWDRYLAPRVMSLRNLTLAHGDGYLSQFLCPNDGTGPTYLIDFQDISGDFVARDLVHLCAFFWTPDQRHAGGREERLLRRYLAGLHQWGVRDYSWDDLLTDYRLLIILLALYPVWDQTNGSRRSYWQPKMHCILGAYRDLDCAALLAS